MAAPRLVLPPGVRPALGSGPALGEALQEVLGGAGSVSRVRGSGLRPFLEGVAGCGDVGTVGACHVTWSPCSCWLAPL